MLGDLVFQLPSVPPGWQFLIDIIPGQLAAEKLARLSGVDSDTFRYCSFIVEDEYGLLPQENGSPNEKRSIRFTGISSDSGRRSRAQPGKYVIGAV